MATLLRHGAWRQRFRPNNAAAAGRPQSIAGRASGPGAAAGAWAPLRALSGLSAVARLPLAGRLAGRLGAVGAAVGAGGGCSVILCDAPAAAADAWTAHVDPASGKTYYYNAQTQATSWEKPATVQVQAAAEAARAVQARADPWDAHVDAASGKNYYVNRLTQETAWVKPAVSAAPSDAAAEGGELKHVSFMGMTRVGAPAIAMLTLSCCCCACCIESGLLHVAAYIFLSWKTGK